jgi:two-component system nitrate/nitrite response regulator NarL
VRLVLCDDHKLFIESLATVLARRGHEVVVTLSPDQALQIGQEFRPHVCVIDLGFPHADGLAAVPQLRLRLPSCAIVVLSGSGDPADQSAALAAGAAGFLRKDLAISTVLDAIERAGHGRRLVRLAPPRPPVTSAEHLRVRRLVEALTDRERQVLRSLVEAEDTAAIAHTLGVAQSTARTHLQNVLLKLGVHTRLQAVTLVADAGLADQL